MLNDSVQPLPESSVLKLEDPVPLFILLEAAVGCTVLPNILLAVPAQRPPSSRCGEPHSLGLR